MRSGFVPAGLVLGLLLLLAVVGPSPLPPFAQAAPAKGQETTFLPLLQSWSQPVVADCNVSGSSYRTLPVNGEPTGMPAAEHPDLNLALRSWSPSSAIVTLVDYGPVSDARAPQLDTLFGNPRLPNFSAGWVVSGWDWVCGCPAEADRPWELTLLGMETASNEVIYTPDSGYDIGDFMDPCSHHDWWQNQ